MTSPPLIPAIWQLPESFSKRLGKTVGRQRVFFDQAQLLIVAHLPPKADEKSRQGLLIWRDEKGQWKASNGERGPQSILTLLSAYAKQLDEFEQLENRATRSDEYLSLLDNLSPLVRSIRSFFEVLQEARTSAKEVPELIDFRDKAYELSRQADLLYQDTRNAMDVSVIRRAEEQSINTARLAQANHRLNRMVALFLPLTTLAAVFGTQFTQDWTWLNNPMNFTIFVLSGIFAGVLLLAFISRK